MEEFYYVVEYKEKKNAGSHIPYQRGCAPQRIK